VRFGPPGQWRRLADALVAASVDVDQKSIARIDPAGGGIEW
jgi:hypothetical protein